MANPDSRDIFSQFMLDLQASTQAVPGMVSDQVLIGPTEFHTGDNFYQDVACNGYYFVIEPPSGQGDFVTFNGKFKLSAFLFYPVPADKTYDWVATNQQIGNLISGWSHWTAQGTWVSGNNRSPVRMTFDKPYIRYRPKPSGYALGVQSFIVSTRFVFELPYIADQACNPFESPAAS